MCTASSAALGFFAEAGAGWWEQAGRATVVADAGGSIVFAARTWGIARGRRRGRPPAAGARAS